MEFVNRLMGKLFNLEDQNDFRRTLRNNQTPAEQKLWTHLKGKQLGQKFRRQFGIGSYVVDFYCPSLKLVIELDGDSHFERRETEKDVEREKFLNHLQIRVLRFTNDQIYFDLEGVLDVIRTNLH